jgi:aspartyl protease family protein
MAEPNGPWQTSEERPPSSGLWAWLGFVVAAGVGVWLLARLFPGALETGEAQANFITLAAILTVVSSGVFFARRRPAGEILRNLAIWVALTLVLVLGYTFRDELQQVGTRVASEFAPGQPVSADGNSFVLTAAEDGHFYVLGSVSGTRVRFLIDTGASQIVLSPSDAARIGLDPGALRFTRSYETANGIGRGATATLDNLAIGPVELTDVPVAVNEAEMSTSLLGMAFLNRLESFQIQGRRMVLRWR